VHAAEHDDVRVGPGRFLGQAQRVADVVADVLDLAPLVVVPQDDRVELAFALLNPPLELGSIHLEVIQRGREGAIHQSNHGKILSFTGRIRDAESREPTSEPSDQPTDAQTGQHREKARE
jgi:hypothetical protein